MIRRVVRSPASYSSGFFDRLPMFSHGLHSVSIDQCSAESGSQSHSNPPHHRAIELDWNDFSLPISIDAHPKLVTDQSTILIYGSYAPAIPVRHCASERDKEVRNRKVFELRIWATRTGSWLLAGRPHQPGPILHALVV